jgi:hypothetical protein
MKYLESYNKLSGPKRLNGMMANHQLTGGTKEPFNDREKDWIEKSKKMLNGWTLEVIEDNSFIIIQDHEPEDARLDYHGPVAYRIWKFEGYFMKLTAQLKLTEMGGVMYFKSGYVDYNRKWDKYEDYNLREVVVDNND